MTSSCTSAAAWKTSSAAAAVTTVSGAVVARPRRLGDRAPAGEAEAAAEALAARQGGGRGLDEQCRFGAEIGGQRPADP